MNFFLLSVDHNNHNMHENNSTVTENDEDTSSNHSTMSSNSFGPGDGTHEQRPYTSSGYHRTTPNTSSANVNSNNRDSYNNRDFYGVSIF